MSKASILTPPKPPSARTDITWQGLAGSSVALALAELIDQHDKPVLIVTPDAPQAHRVEHEMQYLSRKGDQVMVFPDLVASTRSASLST